MPSTFQVGFVNCVCGFNPMYFMGSFLKAGTISNCGSSMLSLPFLYENSTLHTYPEWLQREGVAALGIPPKKRRLPWKFRTSTSIHPRWHVETPARGVSICNEGIPVVLVKGVIGFFLEKKNHYAQIYASLMRPFCQDLSTCKMWTIQILGVWDPGSEIFIFRLILSFAGAGGCWFQFWNRWCLCCDIITHLYLHQTEECPGSLWRLWGAVGTPFHATFLAKLASV